MQKFAIGDQVISKNGGPKMMIINDRDFTHSNHLGYHDPVFTGEYLCSWYDNNFKTEKYFSEDSIELYNPKIDL